MSEKIEDLTFDYTNEDGVLVRREVDRAVLSKGAWATIMYLYQDLDRSAGRYRAPKVAIVRYRKTNGVYRKQSSFNISSERQGRMIMEVLDRWYGMTEADLPPAELNAAQKAESQSETSVQDAPAGTPQDPVTGSAPAATESPVSPPVQESAVSQEPQAPVEESSSPFGGTHS